MAQLSQDYGKFQSKNVEILVLGPDGPNAFRRYWETNSIPFIGMADIKSQVAGTFYQVINLFKLGRMPAQFIIDLDGMIRYAHYGDSMADIPSNEILLELIDRIRMD
jgi:peroxiredoxin Q/BCP